MCRLLACGPETYIFPDAKGPVLPEGNNNSGTEQAPASRQVIGKENWSRDRSGQGVGRLHRSVDVGERRSTRTRPSTGSPCCCDFQEGLMPHALTLEDMSPGLVKVVERAQHEPERRFHSRAHRIDVPALQQASCRQHAAEPDGGNLLVRSWRGAGLGNRLAYSTSPFCVALHHARRSPARCDVDRQGRRGGLGETHWSRRWPAGDRSCGTQMRPRRECWQRLAVAV
jgi:hypothetical protein